MNLKASTNINNFIRAKRLACELKVTCQVIVDLSVSRHATEVGSCLSDFSTNISRHGEQI